MAEKLLPIGRLLKVEFKRDTDKSGWFFTIDGSPLKLVMSFVTGPILLKAFEFLFSFPYR